MASRLNNASRRYNYPNELVFDEAGQLIKPGVTSYGARGLNPAYYLDEDENIVELGFLKKVNFYKEKKNLDVATQLALIDERITDLTYDGKDLMQRLVNSSQNENDTRNAINGVSTVVGFVAGVIGTPAAGNAVAAGLKVLGGAIYLNNNHIDKYKRKLNSLEKEAKYLLITKNKLTGEYAKLAAVKTSEEPTQLSGARSSSEANNTFLYVLIIVVFLIIRKKRK